MIQCMFTYHLMSINIKLPVKRQIDKKITVLYKFHSINLKTPISYSLQNMKNSLNNNNKIKVRSPEGAGAGIPS